MSDYGFVMRVDDLTSSQMKKIESSVKGLSSTVKTETGNMQSNFAGLGESAKQLTGYLASAFAVHEIVSFGKELLHVAAEFQGFANVIKYSSIGTVDAAQNMGYLENAITRLKLPMRETYESFSEMEAGFYGTGIEGEKLRKVFEGVAEASSVLHLNPATFSRVTFALKEIGELGTLQARQLRMLSFSLPGAGNLAAQSMGMTSAQLHEAMKKSSVNASDFLPKFAETLTKHFEKGLHNAGESLISQMNVMSNAMLSLKLDMGEKLSPFFTHVMESITSGMQTIKSIWDSLTSNSNFVDTLKFLYDWTVKLVPIWAGYRLIMAGWNGIIALSTTLEGLFTREIITNTVATAANGAAMGFARVEVGGFAAMMSTAAVEVETATGAMVGLEAALATFGIGAIIIGFGLLVEKLISLNQEARDFADIQSQISQTGAFHKETSKMYVDISNRFADYGKTNASKEDKAILLKDALEAQRYIQDKKNKEFDPALHAAQRANDAANKILGYSEQQVGTTANGIAITKKLPVFAQDEVVRSQFLKNLGQQSNDSKFATVQLKNLGSYIKTLIDQGIKPAKAGTFGGEGGTMQEGATNTSQLAGASGGLGQAKIVNQHIGVLQQNNGVHESKDNADDTLRILLELVNGFNESQNSQ